MVVLCFGRLISKSKELKLYLPVSILILVWTEMGTCSCQVSVVRG